MPRHGFALVVLLSLLFACQAPALPTLDVPRTATPVSVAVSNPTAVPPTVAPATETPASTATTAPATAATSPTAARSATSTRSATPSRSTAAPRSATPPRSTTAPRTASRTATSTGSTITATRFITATLSPTATRGISTTNIISATSTISGTATRRPTARPRPTQVPAGPPVVTQILSGQRVTALYVTPDGTIYYGVAPSDESLQFPADTVFQLWKLPPGGSPYAITPDSMHMIGGVVVHAGTIYFNELGTLRRMPDNNQVSEGEIVIRYPAYQNNRDLPYGHMNNSLAIGTVNGQEALLMGMGSVLDSSYPGAGVPANIAPPYYEEFPTGRIVYATFDWLNQQHEYVGSRGAAGQFDEYARGVRNPWGMTVGAVNGQPMILAVDNDPSFTPEKYDAVPDNAGDELNSITPATDFGHPYYYGGGQPIVNFPDTSVPSGVAVAAGKIFVGLQVGNVIVKVDPVTHTYKPVIENVFPFNLFAVGNLLYIANFNGIHVIDAGGL